MKASPLTRQSTAMADATIARLSRTPWCHALISSPHWTPISTESRVPKASSEDSFFAETLGTARTIRACLTLRSPEESGDRTDDTIYQEVRTIFELGDGLNGFPKIAHGGFVVTMLDEVMGVLITTNVQGRAERQRRAGLEGDGVMSCFTACELRSSSRADGSDAEVDLNVTYKKPLPTPAVVLCTAKIERRERNKVYMRGTVEDGLGTVFTTAEGMFVETKPKL